MLTSEQILQVKSRGFLRNRGTDCFSGRVVSVAGIFSTNELRALAACAEAYGNGKVIFTSRLSAEIVGIPFEKIPQAEAFLAAQGLSFGGTGAKIRPITACKGTTCVYGNIDTHALAQTVHDKFYVGMRDVKLPHKFKIGIGGCPNSCMKPSLNDVGIEGCKTFTFQKDLCRNCKVCAVMQRCSQKAFTLADKKVVLDEHKCIHCGVCVGACPFGAIPREAESVCRVFVGGTWGKSQRMGSCLRNVYPMSEIPTVIEKILLWYKENGLPKERLGKTVDRLGLDALEAALATDDLLLRKEAILALP